MTSASSQGPPAPSGVGEALRNVRRTVGLQLAAPLDAAPRAGAASDPVDPVLAAVVVALVGFGVVMVYSASAVQATVQYHDPQFFLKRQAAYALAAPMESSPPSFRETVNARS